MPATLRVRLLSMLLAGSLAGLPRPPAARADDPCNAPGPEARVTLTVTPDRAAAAGNTSTPTGAPSSPPPPAPGSTPGPAAVPLSPEREAELRRLGRQRGAADYDSETATFFGSTATPVPAQMRILRDRFLGSHQPPLSEAERQALAGGYEEGWSRAGDEFYAEHGMTTIDPPSILPPGEAGTSGSKVLQYTDTAPDPMWGLRRLADILVNSGVPHLKRAGEKLSADLDAQDQQAREPSAPAATGQARTGPGATGAPAPAGPAAGGSSSPPPSSQGPAPGPGASLSPQREAELGQLGTSRAEADWYTEELSDMPPGVARDHARILLDRFLSSRQPPLSDQEKQAVADAYFRQLGAIQARGQGGLPGLSFLERLQIVGEITAPEGSAPPGGVAVLSAPPPSWSDGTGPGRQVPWTAADARPPRVVSIQGGRFDFGTVRPGRWMRLDLNVHGLTSSRWIPIGGGLRSGTDSWTDRFLENYYWWWIDEANPGWAEVHEFWTGLIATSPERYEDLYYSWLADDEGYWDWVRMHDREAWLRALFYYEWVYDYEEDTPVEVVRPLTGRFYLYGAGDRARFQNVVTQLAVTTPVESFDTSGLSPFSGVGVVGSIGVSLPCLDKLRTMSGYVYAEPDGERKIAPAPGLDPAGWPAAAAPPVLSVPRETPP